MDIRSSDLSDSMSTVTASPEPAPAEPTETQRLLDRVQRGVESLQDPKSDARVAIEAVVLAWRIFKR